MKNNFEKLQKWEQKFKKKTQLQLIEVMYDINNNVLSTFTHSNN